MALYVNIRHECFRDKGNKADTHRKK